MREIKFRQPVYEDGKLIRWHYWGFKDGLYQHTHNQHQSYQFTGLKDKNEKEIYEGDIARITLRNEYGSLETRIGVMEFWQEEAQFSFKFQSEWSFNQAGNIEVIGNILENPDLLN